MIKLCSIHGLLTSMLLIVFSLMSNDAIAQKAIRGTVLDEANDPIIGASVLVKGTTNGSITGVDGTFNVKANPSDVLVISYVGYVTVEQQVGNQTQFLIHLREDSKVLNDVVVIGYGSTTKKELTGSVTSMKKDDLNPGTFTNAMGMLQGKVAGLQIINPNGADPTAKYEVLLRGTNTLSAGQGPLIIIDGVAGADIRNINFQEVESIDVLKDGSAAAIYGTRGTNGVIIVTTKRARSGKTEVSYDGQFTVGAVSRRAKPLSANEYKSVIKEYRPELESYIFDSDTDWFKEITQTPFSHKHNLSISGGSEKFSHHTSFNYEKSEGLQKHNSSEKLMARTNIRQSLLDKWVDLDYNLNIIHRKYSPSSTSAFMQAFTHNPTEPVYDDSDPDAGGYSRIKAMEYYNPVAIINERNMESKNDNYGANIRATLNILPIKGLKWENFVSYDKEQYETREYYTHYYPSLIGTKGQAYIQNYQENDTQYESTLNYSNIFGKHSIQALLGYTYQYTYSTSASMTNSGFDFDDNQTHNIGTGTNLTEGKASMSSNKEDNTYIGFFGRFMYNYDDKYLLSASLRRDGSSRFGDNNKWGWFPSVSAGWRISEESFIKERAKWLNQLKLRLSYGVTGTDAIESYANTDLLDSAGYILGEGNGSVVSGLANNSASLGNRALQWEQTNQANFGLDISLLNNRIGLTFDYYSQISKNQIMGMASSWTTGYNYRLINAGKIENKGIEIALSTRPIQTRDFSWDINLNFSKNSNKVKELDGESDMFELEKESWLDVQVAAKVGENFGSIVGPDFQRNEKGDILIDPQTGLPQYDKSNHVLGNASWDWTGGLLTNFTYKNLSLVAVFDVKVGADLYSMSARAAYESGKSPETLAGRDAWYRSEEERLAAGIAKGADNWKPTGGFVAPGVIDNGDGTYRPNDIYINPEDYWMSVCRNAPSMFIYDNSYVKCRELTLSYNVPKSWLKNVVSGLTVSFVARNPFIVWKNIPNIDPDSNYNNTTGMGLEYGSLPSRRSYGFNVNVKF